MEPKVQGFFLHGNPSMGLYVDLEDLILSDFLGLLTYTWAIC
jgi:hypothetical protein